MTSGAGTWLRFQLLLLGAGAAVWYVGVMAESEFVSGVGVGILVTALALRFLRRRVPRDPNGPGSAA